MKRPEKRLDPAVDTLSPSRNFTLSVADRVRSLVAGVPAYIRRRRAIEDLEERMIDALAEGTPPEDLAASLEKLRKLVELHNRFYPIEAELPLDPFTGVMLERGAPWRPMPAPSIEALAARAGQNARDRS